MKRTAVIILIMLCVCVSPFFGCSETDWREFMDETTIVVCVVKEKIAKNLTCADFGESGVSRLIHIDGVDSERHDFYAAKLRNKEVGAALEKICEFDFVFDAWQNLFDYNANIKACEEKKPKEIRTDRIFFDDSVTVVIDKSFMHRIFTKEDFNIAGIDSVTWNNFGDHEYYHGDLPDTYRPAYSVYPVNRSDRDIIALFDALYELDFVNEVSLHYPLTDDMGIRGD